MLGTRSSNPTRGVRICCRLRNGGRIRWGRASGCKCPRCSSCRRCRTDPTAGQEGVWGADRGPPPVLVCPPPEGVLLLRRDDAKRLATRVRCSHPKVPPGRTPKGRAKVRIAPRGVVERATARGVDVAPTITRRPNGRPRQPTPLAGTPKGMPPAGGRGHRASGEHPWVSRRCIHVTLQGAPRRAR